MNSINYKALHDELKEGMIFREYQMMFPTMGLRADVLNRMPELALNEYRNNAVFHARIDSLVAGIVHIVDKHVAGKSEQPRYSYEDVLEYAMNHDLKVDFPL